MWAVHGSPPLKLTAAQAQDIAGVKLALSSLHLVFPPLDIIASTMSSWRIKVETAENNRCLMELISVWDLECGQSISLWCIDVGKGHCNLRFIFEIFGATLRMGDKVLSLPCMWRDGRDTWVLLLCLLVSWRRGPLLTFCHCYRRVYAMFICLPWSKVLVVNEHRPQIFSWLIMPNVVGNGCSLLQFSTLPYWANNTWPLFLCFGKSCRQLTFYY